MSVSVSEHEGTVNSMVIPATTDDVPQIVSKLQTTQRWVPGHPFDYASELLQRSDPRSKMSVKRYNRDGESSIADLGTDSLDFSR